MITKKQYINYLIFLFISVVCSSLVFCYLPSAIYYLPAWGPILIPQLIGIFVEIFIIIVAIIMINKLKTLDGDIYLLEKKQEKRTINTVLIIEIIITTLLVTFLFILYFVILPLIAENKDIMNYNEFLRYIINNAKQDWCLLLVNTLIFVLLVIIDRYFLFNGIKKEKKSLFWINYISVFALCTSFLTYFLAGSVDVFCELFSNKLLFTLRNDLYIYFSLIGYVSYFLLKFNFLQKIK